MSTLKTEDFRIGNFMMDEISGEWLRVVELTEMDVVTSVINRDKYPLPDGWQMVPIRITRDILLMLGFTISIGGVASNGKRGFFFDEVDSQIFWEGVRVKTVHHLQNLYFALAGEEICRPGDLPE